MPASKSSFIVSMRPPIKARRLARRAPPIELADKQDVLWLKSGRLALFCLLANIAELDKRREILLPAYHCRSIVDACMWAGLKPRYYRLNDDLSPVISSVESQISASTLSILVIHFFGFIGSLKWVSNFRNRNELTVIEDAAHVDLTDNALLRHIGLHSDWVIGSLRKFFPIYDGGCLFPVERSHLDFESVDTRPTLRDELRGALFLCHNIAAQIGTRPGETDKDDQDVAGRLLSRRSPESEHRPSGYSDPRFSPDSTPAMSRISRLVMRASKDPAAREIRRRNYARLIELTNSLSRCRPLFSALPNQVVPYVFPLLLEFPDQDHGRLRSAGIEVYRWEELAPSNCSISQSYKRSLIQLPCHQDISDQQNDYMDEVIARVLK